jgi:uncharacterized protein YigE (DUF2233 family)
MRFKFVFLLVLIIGIFIFTRSQGETLQDQSAVEVTTTPTITIEPSHTQTGIQSSWFIVNDISKLSLHSNLEDKLSVNDYKEKNNCESIINGGFYSEEGKHIGLFIEDGRLLQKEQLNQLFNGYFSAQSRTVSISTDRPTGPRFALQTGPILIADGQMKTLKLMRDEKARRMVVGITESGNVVFMTFYDASTLTSGPKLVELPQLVQKLNEENNLNITDAINLDGGNHSAFISDEVQLTDIQTPGSYFCVRE